MGSLAAFCLAVNYILFYDFRCSATDVVHPYNIQKITFFDKKLKKASTNSLII